MAENPPVETASTQENQSQPDQAQTKSDQATESLSHSAQAKETTPELSLTQQIFALIWKNEFPLSDQQTSKLKSLFVKFWQEELESLLDKYFVVFLWSSSSIQNSTLDEVYNGLQDNIDSDGKPKKPVLLIVKSGGGSIEPAYKISKLCNALSNGNFIVVIPREAKSAATLICLGACEIHMGYLSELGPIDPQIRGLPALGLQDSMKYIANLVKEVPEATELFSNYLNKQLRLDFFGWANRVSESAVQYGQKLLEINQAKTNVSAKNISTVVKKLVTEYKDHGFVIDSDEALALFEQKLIRKHTDEYKAVEKFYKGMSLLMSLLEYKGQDMHLVGGAQNEGCISFVKREE